MIESKTGDIWEINGSNRMKVGVFAQFWRGRCGVLSCDAPDTVDRDSCPNINLMWRIATNTQSYCTILGSMFRRDHEKKIPLRAFKRL